MVKDTVTITDPVEAGILISRWEMIWMVGVTDLVVVSWRLDGGINWEIDGGLTGNSWLCWQYDSNGSLGGK